MHSEDVLNHDTFPGARHLDGDFLDLLTKNSH